MALCETEWLRRLFNAWIGVRGDDEFIEMFQELIRPLPGLIEKRAFYVKTLVEIEDPGPYKNEIDEALANLSGGSSAFGLFGFGHKEEKALLARVKIDGEPPRSPDQWEMPNVIDTIHHARHTSQILIKPGLYRWPCSESTLAIHWKKLFN